MKHDTPLTMLLWGLYNVLFGIGFVLMLPHYLLRMRRRGGYRRGFLQRFGVYPPALREALRARPRVWVHAVSVGEVFVALQFMEEMRRRRPALAFALTTTTSTGHRMAEQRLHADDVLLYLPPDFPVVLKRVFDMVQPRALILTECELWPNLVRTAKRREVPVMLINGRISEASYRGYRRLRAVFRPVLRAFDLVHMQTEDDRRRLVELGVNEACITAMGTAKYDVAHAEPGDPAVARRILAEAGIEPGGGVLLGGSTWPGEEAELVELFARLRDRFAPLSLVLVPRHAERGDELEALLRASGLPYVRRSTMPVGGAAGGEAPAVLLADTTGELRHLYTCASVIYVGKSLFNHGGQNVIEPALQGRPIVVGPNMENFPVVVQDFLAADALLQVPDAAGLGVAVERLLGDARVRDGYGERAKQVVMARLGTVGRSVDAILELLQSPPAPGEDQGGH